MSWLPIDLTLLFFVLTAVYVICCFVKSNGRIPLSIFWMTLLFALFSVPLFWTEWNDYSVEKVTRLYSLTLLAALAPFILFRESGEVRRLFHCLTALALFMGMDALVALFSSGSFSVLEHSTGISAFGSNTIALGRAAGMAFIWLAVLALEGRLRVPTTLFLLGILGVVLFASGSRGPLLATFASLGVLIALFYRREPRHALRLIGMGLLVSVVLLYSVTVAPANATNRIEHFLKGDLGSSELMRLEAFTLSWETIKTAPAGIGWGGFPAHINLWFGASHQYPHNLTLEVLLEGGWLPGVYMTLLFLFGFIRICRYGWTMEAKAIFALLLFFILNAMVSGDLNDNKVLFAFLALALAYRGERRKDVQNCPS